MYVDKIELTNIRGFERLEFDLSRPDGNHAGWTVFTGDNGSGKSSLLKAIAVALTGEDTARALQPSFHRWVREGKGASEGEVRLTIRPVEDDDSFVGGGGGKVTFKNFEAVMKFNKSGKDVTAKTGSELKKKVRDIPTRGLWSPQTSGWFACGYGPFRRVFGASPEATRLMVGATTERFVTMFQEAASLFEVDQWLRSLSHKKLENKTEETAHLELLLDILGDDLMPNQVTVDRVDSDGLWLKDRRGLPLAWGDMSDGYRSAMALLADILRHLIATYGIGGLAKPGANGKWQIDRGGVVMIDEIDAHLHPEWQQKIGFWLVRHFPKIQFLVTTHSPIICQAASKNGLFVLPEPGGDSLPRALTTDEYNKVVASRPDTILLSPAFGLQNTRSQLAVDARADYGKLNAKRRTGAKLSAEEEARWAQIEMFVSTNEGL